MEQNIKKEPLGGIFINVSSEHTFGTDAVLLADFATAKKKDRVIDLGSGCGIIPCLMLRDNRTLNVTGVEISTEACRLLEKTKEQQGLGSLNIINSDLNCLKGKIEFGRATLITCNPPYKAAGAGIISTSQRDKLARHETACTLEDIVSVSARLLQTSGRLCVCLRPERLAELMDIMREHKIEPKRLRLVCKNKNTAPWLFLLEGKKCAKSGMVIEPNLFVENEDGSYSDEMIKIYGEYKEAYL